MKPTPNIHIEHCRRVHPTLGPSEAGCNWGYFEVNLHRDVAGLLRIIASDGTEDNEKGWEHVSVSLADRCPTWGEMCLVKEMFWSPEETVIQFHPNQSAYLNCHPYCLHLWKKRGCHIELPPSYLIAPSKH